MQIMKDLLLKAMRAWDSGVKVKLTLMKSYSIIDNNLEWLLLYSDDSYHLLQDVAPWNNRVRRFPYQYSRSLWTTGVGKLPFQITKVTLNQQVINKCTMCYRNIILDKNLCSSCTKINTYEVSKVLPSDTAREWTTLESYWRSWVHLTKDWVVRALDLLEDFKIVSIINCYKETNDTTILERALLARDSWMNNINNL